MKVKRQGLCGETSQKTDVVVCVYKTTLVFVFHFFLQFFFFPIFLIVFPSLLYVSMLFRVCFCHFLLSSVFSFQLFFCVFFSQTTQCLVSRTMIQRRRSIRVSTTATTNTTAYHHPLLLIGTQRLQKKLSHHNSVRWRKIFGENI